MKSFSHHAALGLLGSLALTAALATPAFAQPAPAPAAPAPAAPAAPAPAAPAAPAPAAPAAPMPATPDLLATALAPQMGGLTPEEAGKIAATTKHSVRAKQAELRAAAAKVDQALVNYFPRLSVTASYTRLSPITPPSLGGGGGLVGALNTGPLQTGPCQPPATGTCVVDSGGVPVQATAFSFPVLLNNYSLVASLSVPVSDYLLRISQGYASALHAEKGKRYESEAEALQAAADARISFFNWVRAKGQEVVAQQSVEQARAHVDDAKRVFSVGLLSRGDVLRLEAQVASAEQFSAEAQAFAAVAEEQLRTTLNFPADKKLSIGADVMHAQAAPPSESLAKLQETALSRRLEIRALDETELSLKETVSLARAGLFPRVDAFGNVYYSNPNQRIFPVQDKFTATWDVGVRLSWTVNDTFSAIGSTAEAKARALSVAEQKASLRDGLRLEVASAYTEALKGAATIAAAERGLVAAEEALRVRRELFRNGKATATDLVDAETEVTRARLGHLNAHIGMLAARVRLDHAVGRDVPQRTQAE